MTTNLTQRQYVLLLAGIAGLILVIGALLRPEAAPEVASSPVETSRLQTLAQRVELENRAAYFAQIAANIEPALVWLNAIESTGLIWNQDGLIVTAGPREHLRRQVTALTGIGEIPLDAQLLSPGFDVAALKAPLPVGLTAVRKGSAERVGSGMPILQVARQAGGGYLFTPAVLSGTGQARCGGSEYRTVRSDLPLTDASLGSGLFDVDSNLLAVVIRCGSGHAAVTPDSVDAAIERANTTAGRLLRAYGFEAVELDEAAQAHFGLEAGVLIARTFGGEPADQAGLTPGDIITEVAGQPVATIEDLAPLVSPEDGNEYEVGLRRGSRTETVMLVRGDSLGLPAPGQDSPGIGFTPPPGYRIETVAPGSRAERAGIQVGDRLLLVNGNRPASLAAAQRALSATGEEGAFLVVERGSQKLGLYLR